LRGNPASENACLQESILQDNRHVVLDTLLPQREQGQHGGGRGNLLEKQGVVGR